MITINGKIYHGNSLSTLGDRIYIDDKLVDDNPETNARILTVQVDGDLVSLNSDVSVHVNGDVHGSVKCGGSANCGDVSGDVKTGGSVNCGNVRGDIKAGGSVNRR